MELLAVFVVAEFGSPMVALSGSIAAGDKSIRRRLRQLHSDLHLSAAHDPDQEVPGVDPVSWTGCSTVRVGAMPGSGSWPRIPDSSGSYLTLRTASPEPASIWATV